MRLGLIGAADGSLARLQEAMELLLDRLEANPIVYLGSEHTARRAVARWATERLGPLASEERFLAEAARAAASRDAERLGELLERESQIRRLGRLRLLPPRTRAVEMLGDRIVLLVRDKADLEEEDIASAHVVVFGRSGAPEFRRFGPRVFYTPGPLSAGHVGLLETDERGRGWAVTLDLQGREHGRESLGRRQSRVVLSS